MREDYKPYFQRLKAAMDKFGYVSLIEEELGADFTLENGWIVEFACEKYYGPGYRLLLVFKNGIINEKAYSISRLKLTFERLKGCCYKNLPEDDMEANIEFLKREKETIFENLPFYDDEYQILGHKSLSEANAIIASHKAGIVTPAATKPPPKEL